MLALCLLYVTCVNCVTDASVVWETMPVVCVLQERVWWRLEVKHLLVAGCALACGPSPPTQQTK